MLSPKDVPPEFSGVLDVDDFDFTDPDIANIIKAMMSDEGSNSVLSDYAILEAYNAGKIKIHPFDKSQLNNCSYDVRLGKWYYKQVNGKEALEKKTGKRSILLFEPGPSITPSTIHEMWDGPHEMKVNKDPKLDVPYDCRCIQLAPGETILVNTFEFIGACEDITTCMKAKSTTARMCVSVCGDAGWGDIGYANRWCMQIRNNGIRNVILVYGMKIAQIVFHKSSRPRVSYSEEGHYQTTDDFNSIMAEWEPESMLPNKKLSLPDEFLLGGSDSESEDSPVGEPLDPEVLTGDD